MLSPLYAQTVRQESLGGAERGRLFALMQHCYDNVHEERFYADLQSKQHVILLRVKRTREIVGFSTIRLQDDVINGKPAELLFSGDTVIHPDWWGHKNLQTAFGAFVVRRILARPMHIHLWLLLSKGYRTYLLMVNYFPRSHPRVDAPPPPGWPEFLERVATSWWPQAYQAERGILRFPEQRDFVRAGIAPLSGDVRSVPSVAYFLERNPGHAHGDELVCLAQLRIVDIVVANLRIAWVRLRRLFARGPAEKRARASA